MQTTKNPYLFTTIFQIYQEKKKSNKLGFLFENNKKKIWTTTCIISMQAIVTL